MTNRVLWLLSYVGLSLGLALGNRQTTIGDSRIVDDRAVAEAMSSGGRVAAAYRLADLPTTNLRRANARTAAHDWLLYDKRTGSNAMLSPDRLILLDDVLSVVLGNFYRQQQQQQQQRQQDQRHHQELTSTQRNRHTSHPLNFLYDEEDEDLDDASVLGEEDEEELTAQSQPRMLSRRGRPYDSNAMYVESLAPMQSVARLRSSGTSLGTDDAPAHRSSSHGTALSASYLAETDASAAKSPGKRNQAFSSSSRQESKESEQQQQQQEQAESAASMVAQAGASMASQFMLRAARGGRQYDVPQIDCPMSDDGMERFACPSPDRQGRFPCIEDHVLCNGFIDCPAGEDEDRQACMFYKTTKAHLDVLADALLRWARGR